LQFVNYIILVETSQYCTLYGYLCGKLLKVVLVLWFVHILVKEPSFVCIVTEFMERGTVRDLLLSKSRLEWNIRLNWALDTATGMAYLHSLEPCIIHRDLKTTNLLVDRGFNVKICDFGLSRFMSKDSVMSAVGTVQFAAPEVCIRL
jgi:serine/threonine protein kinase